MNTGNSVLVHYTKVYSLLQFISCCWEKKREFVSWVNHIRWTKETCQGEREQTQNLDFLSVFSCCSNRFVSRFCLHWFTSGGVWDSFWSTPPKIGATIFSLLLPGWCSTDSLYCRHVFWPMLLSQVVPLLPRSVGGRIISVSSGSTPVQKIWVLQWRGGFLVIFD